LAANNSISDNYDVMPTFNRDQKDFTENITVNYITYVNERPIKICN